MEVVLDSNVAVQDSNLAREIIKLIFDVRLVVFAPERLKQEFSSQ